MYVEKGLLEAGKRTKNRKIRIYGFYEFFGGLMVYYNIIKNQSPQGKKREKFLMMVDR